MQDYPNNNTEEELKKWVKDQLDSAVRELIDQGMFASVIVEAKPAWVFPFGLLIGMIREQDEKSGFAWFITGDFPTSTVHSTVASSAREAARHFALQWQLEAKRLEDSFSGAEVEQETTSVPAGDQLVVRAQSLYELVEQDELWQEG